MADDHTIELEIKVAYLEKNLGELDSVVRRLSDEMELMKRELARLRAANEQSSPLPHERPPHY